MNWYQVAHHVLLFPFYLRFDKPIHLTQRISLIYLIYAGQIVLNKVIQTYSVGLL